MAVSDRLAYCGLVATTNYAINIVVIRRGRVQRIGSINGLVPVRLIIDLDPSQQISNQTQHFIQQSNFKTSFVKCGNVVQATMS